MTPRGFAFGKVMLYIIGLALGVVLANASGWQRPGLLVGIAVFGWSVYVGNRSWFESYFEDEDEEPENQGGEV